MLIGAGIDVNAKNNDGKTALQLARETMKHYPEARAEVVRLLIKGGAQE